MSRLKNIKAKREAIETWAARLELEKPAGINGSYGDEMRRNGEVVCLPADFLANSPEVRAEVTYRIKLKGYIDRERRQIERLAHAEKVRIPAGFDYAKIRGLRRESAIKLAQIRPETLGQASRISGVNPADISILMVWIEAKRRAHG